MKVTKIVDAYTEYMNHAIKVTIGNSVIKHIVGWLAFAVTLYFNMSLLFWFVLYLATMTTFTFLMAAVKMKQQSKMKIRNRTLNSIEKILGIPCTWFWNDEI